MNKVSQFLHNMPILGAISLLKCKFVAAILNFGGHFGVQSVYESYVFEARYKCVLLCQFYGLSYDTQPLQQFF